MIRFSCPDCKQHFSAALDAAGRKMACSSCGRHVQIPTPPEALRSDPSPKPAYRPAPDPGPFYVGAAVVAVICLKVLTVLAIILILCIRVSFFLRLFPR